MPKGKKKRAVITKTEALRRISSMLKNVEEDVRMALWDEAVMEKGNDAVHRLLHKDIPGARAYVVIHQGLVSNLSVTLTRLYDFGSRRYKPNKRQTSSIPMLMRLIKQKRCRLHFIEKASYWYSIRSKSKSNEKVCADAIDRALDAYRNLMRTKGPSTLKRVHHFRNERLAHRKIDYDPTGHPSYTDLFRLIEPAIIIVEQLRLALDGTHAQLADARLSMAEEADEFWRRAFHENSN